MTKLLSERPGKMILETAVKPHFAAEIATSEIFRILVSSSANHLKLLVILDHGNHIWPQYGVLPFAGKPGKEKKLLEFF